MYSEIFQTDAILTASKSLMKQDEFQRKLTRTDRPTKSSALSEAGGFSVNTQNEQALQVSSQFVEM